MIEETGVFNEEIANEALEIAIHIPERREMFERFRVRNDSQATWAMKKLREVLKKQEEQLAIAKNEIAIMERWMESVRNKHSYAIQYFENVLGDYARTQREEGVKTVSTPYGKAATRLSEFKLNCANPVEFLNWARASLPEIIRTKEEMNVSAIKELVKEGKLITDFDKLKLITDNGEVMPAIVLTPPTVTVTITTEE